MAGRIEAQFFRANVGAMILNEDGEILAFERIDRSGFWQMPQGGLDVGEEPAAATLREVEEETGLVAADLRLLAEYPGWLAYELPVELRKPHLGRGQVQKWYCYRLLAEEARIRPEASEHPEFGAWQWMDMEELMRTTTPFRLPVYRELASRFAKWLGCAILLIGLVGLGGCDRGGRTSGGTGGGVTTDGKSIAVDKPTLAAGGEVTWSAVRVTTLDKERLQAFRMVAFYDTDGDAQPDGGEVNVVRAESIPVEHRSVRKVIPAAPGGVLTAPTHDPNAKAPVARYHCTFSFEDGGTYELSGTFESSPQPRSK